MKTEMFIKKSKMPNNNVSMTTCPDDCVCEDCYKAGMCEFCGYGDGERCERTDDLPGPCPSYKEWLVMVGA